jgi:protein-S-isoprenylcysteine O-methyltransferase Ste14
MSPDSPSTRRGITKRAVQVLVMALIIALALFLPAGTLAWTWGWVYLGLYLLGIAVSAYFMFRFNREAIARRAEAQGMKDWDKIVGGLFTLTFFFGIPIVAGLDTRFGWTGEFEIGMHLTGAVFFALGFALFIYAMVTNAYFATVVRIQEDQGHRVCKEGPYKIVRHPGYSGAIFQSLALPLLLGSYWALIPGLLSAALLIVRTALEDKTLHAELKGYHRYTKQVRFRLLPGIW